MSMKEIPPSRAAGTHSVLSAARAAAAAETSSAASGGMKYVTAHNFHTIVESRVKPLPPGANTSTVSSSTTLYQITEHVEFKCSSCRRDRIRDDALALDSQTGRMTCQRCFTRQIRPKNYKPTRLVPFPSLLSWLNFSGGTAAAADAANGGLDLTGKSGGAGGDAPRMAEAVIPSLARAKGLLDGESAGGGGNDGGVAGLIAYTPVQAFTASAVQQQQQHEQQRLANSLQRGGVSSSNLGPTHPCEGVFGSRCVHGATCFFQPAPSNLCLEYLMGICFDSAKCGRVHTRVFDLPKVSENVHPDRWEVFANQKSGNNNNNNNNTVSSSAGAEETAQWKQWVSAKKMSKNQAEWQLWNQGGAMALLNKRFPQPEPPKEAAAAVKEDQEPASALPMKASAIESLLRSLKK